MSEQLDWLARHLHKWPDRCADLLFVGYRPEKSDLTWSSTSIGMSLRSLERITRQQWLDRRAELQGKPSWECAPEWAEWLVQDKDGDWLWFEDEPLIGERDFVHGANFTPESRGEVLGDWRDTRERRPPVMPTVGDLLHASGIIGETISDANKMTAELADKLQSGFEPFSSVEDAPTRTINCRCVVRQLATLHTVHHAAFLHHDCQLLLNEPELVVFRTADGELLHCKPKECLIDPDPYGLAARLLSDMSGCNVAPEHMRELCEQMNWRVAG